MLSNQIQAKGILAKLLGQGLRLLLIKECKKISNIKIDIISSSTQIIKGEIQKIKIFAKDIEYNDLLFDEVELETNNIKINFNITNNKLYLKNNPIVELKISLSQRSLKAVLFSNHWNWIENMISKEILNQDKIEDIKIKNGKILMKASEKNKNVKEGDQINLKAKKGKIYLENKANNKSIQIPIEDKIYIKNVKTQNNLIIIFLNSSISL